ncbi:unnamed protein product [Rotaria sp. Silwood2]|nr:unnamed protein product [Rotaria sp. Silwood2]CAF3196550.1 unnamed protein product [Rotaria sp. Silwood2]CAF3236465.1 unnamed protein product [Rotaria sp. Silwood2]CAF4364719.1 unnamed protein product [Rotaria sp. Silwood2]CAF4469582.1 unnamed protein product [Rotaria sp. Silwood2]
MNVLIVLAVCYLTIGDLVHPSSIDDKHDRLREVPDEKEKMIGTAWSVPREEVRSVTNNENNDDDHNNFVHNSERSSASDFEQRVLELTNEARRSGRWCGWSWYSATTPLQWNNLLGNAARGHAEDMLAHNYFSHNSLDGRTPWDRMLEAGYPGNCAGGENIAGNSSPAAAVQAWIDSSGHCANLMNSEFKTLGVGQASGGAYGGYWVQKFGRC